MTSVHLVSARTHRDVRMLAWVLGICLSLAATACGTDAAHLTDISFSLCRIESAKTAGLIPLKSPRDGTTVYAEEKGTAFGAVDVKAIHIGPDRITGSPCVEIEFTAAGGRKLHAVTSREVGNTIGIVAEGQLIWVARVAEPIDRQLHMTGFKTIDEAKALAVQLAGGNAEQITPAGEEISKTVFVYTATADPTIDRASSTCVVAPVGGSTKELDTAVDLAGRALRRKGYTVIDSGEIDEQNVGKILCLTIALENMEHRIMNVRVFVIQIKIDSSRTKTLTEQFPVIWEGLFGIDTLYYKSRTKKVIAKIIDSYGFPDRRTSEKW